MLCRCVADAVLRDESWEVICDMNKGDVAMVVGRVGSIHLQVLFGGVVGAVFKGCVELLEES